MTNQNVLPLLAPSASTKVKYKIPNQMSELTWKWNCLKKIKIAWWRNKFCWCNDEPVIAVSCCCSCCCGPLVSPIRSNHSYWRRSHYRCSCSSSARRQWRRHSPRRASPASGGPWCVVRWSETPSGAPARPPTGCSAPSDCQRAPFGTREKPPECSGDR